MSNCPTSLPLSQLTDTDEFKNILSGEDLLNLTDPTKQLNQALLLATTDTINDKLDGQKTKESPNQMNPAHFQIEPCRTGQGNEN